MKILHIKSYRYGYSSIKEVLQPSSLFIYYKRKVMNWAFSYSEKNRVEKQRRTPKRPKERGNKDQKLLS